MDDLPIGEVAGRAGIRTSALRFYESVGLLPAPQRVNGHRRYGEDTIRLLRVIRLAQRAGFTVAEIRTLMHGFAPDTPPAERWQPLARHKIQELDGLITQAHQMKRILETALQCGCMRLEDCSSVLEDGGERP